MEKLNKRLTDKEKLSLAYSFICQLLLIFSSLFSIDGQQALVHQGMLLFEPFIFYYLIYRAVVDDRSEFFKSVRNANFFVIALIIAVFVFDIVNFKEMPSLKAAGAK